MTYHPKLLSQVFVIETHWPAKLKTLTIRPFTKKKFVDSDLAQVVTFN